MSLRSVEVTSGGPAALEAAAQRFGTPLYVYDECQLRRSCAALRHLLVGDRFNPRYSVKANANPYLLTIIRQEGFGADAMSPGEIQLLLKCGFGPGEILYVAQNAALEEVRWAYKLGCDVCLDSLDLLAAVADGGTMSRIALRVNPGRGDGHCEKVITAGEKSQFGIPVDQFPQAMEICTRHGVAMVGLHQHIGSSFAKPDLYVAGGRILAGLAALCPDLQWLDTGGGFGIPYGAGETPIDLLSFARGLETIRTEAEQACGKPLTLCIEPGRFIVAECGYLVGRVMSVKKGLAATFVGTDLGFHRLIRPSLYGAVHQPILLGPGQREQAQYAIVGNACETGDYLCRDCQGPLPVSGDYLALEKTGAYGYAMSFSYVGRTRPAEVLICRDGELILIRRREPLSSLWSLAPGFEEDPARIISSSTPTLHKKDRKKLTHGCTHRI